MSTIFTYGYTGYTIDQFCSLLTTYQIDLVIDVRSVPLDKNYPEFNKFSLISTLKEYCSDIRYVHIKELGCSEDIHNLQYEELGFLKYFQQYERYLQKNKKLILELASQITGHNVCLFCSESDPQTCHRTLIADYLQIQNFNSSVIHLVQQEVLS